MTKEVDEWSESPQQEENSLPSKEASLLFTPVAMWSLLGVLLLAIWFKFLPLIIMSTFLLMLGGLIILWKERALKKLRPALHVPQSRLFNEDQFTVEAAVKNDKWLPLVWLEWQFNRGEVVLWGDNRRKAYTMRFLWLRANQEVTWTIKGQANKRGVYEIGKLMLRSGDGFRFTEKVAQYNLQKQLYVYPKLVAVRVPPFSPSMQWGVNGKQGGFLEDPLLINGIREYEPGDEWRRFNWRASARTGKMLTNVYQPVVSEQLMMYIDVQGFTIDRWKYEDEPEKQRNYYETMEASFESFLSLIASTAVTYQEREMSIGFASNGLDYRGERLQSVPPSSKLTLFLDQTAKMVQRTSRRTMASLEALGYEEKGSYPLFIFCERITEAHYRWYEQHRHKRHIRFYYLYNNEFAVKLTKVSSQIEQLLADEAVSSL